MFRMILLTQWKTTRVVLLFATIIGFALPLASIQSAAQRASVPMYLRDIQSFGVFYTILSVAVGLLVALAAWAPDHRGRHVYALSLPVTRSRYLFMRLGAGAVFLLAPTVGVLLGGTIIALFGAIPPGLHVYPVALAVRFLLAGAVAYALFFAIGSSGQRTAGVVLASIVGLFLAQYVLDLTEFRVDLLGRAADLLFHPPGVLSVFTGRWTLVDA